MTQQHMIIVLALLVVEAVNTHNMFDQDLLMEVHHERA